MNQLEIIKLISPMKLTGIYRVLRFNQSRSVAQALHVLISILQLSGGEKGISDFEENFFKLVNNSGFWRNDGESEETSTS